MILLVAGVMAGEPYSTIAISISLAIFVCVAGWIIHLEFAQRGEPDPFPDNLAYFDHFGRMDPSALRDRRGALAEVAKILHEDRIAELLAGRFVVITSSGDDRVRFPMARYTEGVYHFVAIASKYGPRALFFYRSPVSAILTLARGIRVEEREHRICLYYDTKLDFGVELGRATIRGSLYGFRHPAEPGPMGRLRGFIDPIHRRGRVRAVLQRSEIMSSTICGLIEDFIGRETLSDRATIPKNGK
jgi:hypothetical protein